MLKLHPQILIAPWGYCSLLYRQMHIVSAHSCLHSGACGGLCVPDLGTLLLGSSRPAPWQPEAVSPSAQGSDLCSSVLLCRGMAHPSGDHRADVSAVEAVISSWGVMQRKGPGAAVWPQRGLCKLSWLPNRR